MITLVTAKPSKVLGLTSGVIGNGFGLCKYPTCIGCNIFIQKKKDYAMCLKGTECFDRGGFFFLVA